MRSPAKRVLIVDDSAVVRKVLTKEISEHPRLEVIGTAPDPYVARDLIVERKPDVLSLDIEMPRMDGLTFLRKLMLFHPMPVVIVSSLARDGGELAIEALQAGAVSVLHKPTAAFSAQGIGAELTETLVSAACVDVQRAKQLNTSTVPRVHAMTETTNQVLAIGASTGGTTAVETLLKGMPHNLPGTLVCQHMPEGFTTALAKRLAAETRLEVREAEDGDSVVPGRVLIAPGGRHLVLSKSGARYIAMVKEGPRVNLHRPSVDVTFRSVAKVAGKNSVGVILTGMGKDGAEGLLDMRKAGAATVAQDEKSCVVFGMPKAAIDIGAAEATLDLTQIPEYLVRKFSRNLTTDRSGSLRE